VKKQPDSTDRSLKAWPVMAYSARWDWPPRFLPALFLLFVAYGILFPLIWAKKSGNWTAVGFSRQNLSTALAWGAAAGSLWAIYTYLFFGRDGAVPPLWGLQIAIAIPIWLLVMSPFQEFFFRGWLQPRLEAVAGRWRGFKPGQSARQKTGYLADEPARFFRYATNENYGAVKQGCLTYFT
jgi:membrane protease YdiL (CAAX protease family)